MISPTAFPVATIHSDSLALELYACGPGITDKYPVGQFISPAHIAIFFLPRWTPSAIVFHVEIERTIGATPAPHSIGLPSLTTSLDNSILFIRTLMNAPPSDPGTAYPIKPNELHFLVTTLFPFHNAIKRYKTSSVKHVISADWGYLGSTIVTLLRRAFP